MFIDPAKMADSGQSVTVNGSGRILAAGNSRAEIAAQGKPMSFDDMVKQATQQSATANRIEQLGDGRVRVPATLQAIEAFATSDGITVVSTDKKEPGSFSIRPVSLGRVSGPAEPVLSGKVVVDTIRASIVRPNMTEELTSSADGVRQDFVVQTAPEGQGELALELTFEGAALKEKSDGISPTLSSGRELSYHRLLVLDAGGKQLPARFDLQENGNLLIVVSDAGARYPLRIDPTVADADWIGIATPDANSAVYAVVSDGVNIYAAVRLTGLAALPPITLPNGTVAPGQPWGRG